ncbi:hypothetical protein D7S68_17355 [Ralstonia pickettii]|nr:hypothetical protein [Ralstonia pickettii]MBA9888355.1 hypothetical protein [Ralstonia pickettii]MBA9893163.1 hypothetical protein [Ralstonia pickettii]MBA9925407.1 hypothetical protein [Ralstonia pickettii]MBB0178344.1 hypothetical protein [Ralstonia pickettii]
MLFDRSKSSIPVHSSADFGILHDSDHRYRERFFLIECVDFPFNIKSQTIRNVILGGMTAASSCPLAVWKTSQSLHVM